MVMSLRVRSRFLVPGTLCTLALAQSLVPGNLHAQDAEDPNKPAKIAPIPEPSPLLVEPKTPEQFFGATLLMIDLARMDLAKKYLDQFEQAAADDEVLLKLRDKHGTAEFLKLARIKELQPYSTQLLERINTASRAQSENSTFVDGLIDSLLGEDPTRRELAMRELRNAGPSAVPQILRKMSSPDIADKQDLLTVALTRMGRQIVPPLLGGLNAPQERVRVAVIDVLGWLDANEAAPHLWYPAFAEDQPKGVRAAALRTLAKLITGSRDKTDRLSSVTASNELRRLSKLLYQTPELLPQEDDGTVAIWGWEEPQGTVTVKKYSPAIAGMLMSSRFARQSLALSPDQPEPQRQYLASLLGLEVLQNGWDRPRSFDPGTSMYLGLTAGEETVSQVLGDALQAGQPSTAVAALDVLSQIGTRQQLVGAKGLKSPMLSALNSPDPRVQFAAANAILRAEPKNGFPGANRVVSILARALSDPGQPRALVIDGDKGRASNVSGFVEELGFDGSFVSTGREGFENASANAGVELIIVHANCIRWELKQTLANLRSDSRTAAIPIVIYGPESTRDQIARLVKQHSPAVFIAESSTSTDFVLQLRPFVEKLRSPALTANERVRQKEAAAYWLASIASSKSSRVFDIGQAEKDLVVVSENADIGANAIIALGGIGSITSQNRLSNIATNVQLDPTLRESAALQLAYHIQRFNLLLTKDGVAEIHGAWVAEKDPKVKSALASVIGTLRPNAALVGERLQRFSTKEVQEASTP